MPFLGYNSASGAAVNQQIGDYMEAPIYLWAFWEPIHGNPTVQVALVAVSILIFSDLIFGMLAAAINHDFSSTKIREGLAHKCSEFVFLVIADVVDALISVGIELPFGIGDGPALLAICVAIIVMEIASLLEIAVRINPKLADSPVFRVLDTTHLINVTEGDDDAES